jgi:hypothetical protein
MLVLAASVLVLAPCCAAAAAAADQCQPHGVRPWWPTYHILGNVTRNSDGSLPVKPQHINDASANQHTDSQPGPQHCAGRHACRTRADSVRPDDCAARVCCT